MSALRAEVREAFRVLDVPDHKALRAAVALSAALARFEDETAAGFDKRDADVEAIRKDISLVEGEIGDTNTRLAALQGELDGRRTRAETGFDSGRRRFRPMSRRASRRASERDGQPVGRRAGRDQPARTDGAHHRRAAADGSVPDLHSL